MAIGEILQICLKIMNLEKYPSDFLHFWVKIKGIKLHITNLPTLGKRYQESVRKTVLKFLLAVKLGRIIVKLTPIDKTIVFALPSRVQTINSYVVTEHFPYMDRGIILIPYPTCFTKVVLFNSHQHHNTSCPVTGHDITATYLDDGKPNALLPTTVNTHTLSYPHG